MQFGSKRTAALVFVGYAVFGGGAAALAIVLGQSPFETTAWLGTQGVAAAVLSAGIGMILGGATIAATLFMVRRAEWARALHADLRPVVRGAGDGTLYAMALASGIGEEIFFRGILTPLIGVVFSSLAFGLLHQVRGRARWAWAAWATVMGVMLALLFRLTGSLVGPIVLHVYVNAYNLRFLRDNDLAPKRARTLGGLLRKV